MAKLTNDIARTYELGDTSEYPMLGGEIIYEGAAVGINSNGYLHHPYNNLFHYLNIFD